MYVVRFSLTSLLFSLFSKAIPITCYRLYSFYVGCIYFFSLNKIKLSSYILFLFFYLAI